MRGAIGVAVVAWVLALALGCGGGEEQAPPPERVVAKAAPSPSGVDPEAAAAEIFGSRCVTCHGPEGAGDGPASAGLTPAPRNFKDPEWQGSVTDEYIERIIQYGGAAVGRSAAMPGNPDLNSKPELVSALRQLIRGLGRP